VPRRYSWPGCSNGTRTLKADGTLVIIGSAPARPPTGLPLCCTALYHAALCCAMLCHAVLCCAHKSYHSAFSLHLRPSHFAEKYRNSGRGIAPSGHVCFEHLHAALHSAVARLTCTVRGHTINDKNSCTHDNMNSKLEPKKTNLGLQGFAACCKCQRTELSQQ